MKFLREKWDAENKARKADIQAEESAYNIGTPQQSVSVTAGGKTYYFKDQNSANLFRQKAGIK
jgi:YHS domain-containing protein